MGTHQAFDKTAYVAATDLVVQPSINIVGDGDG